MAAVSAPFYTVILERVSYIMLACHHISIFEATSNEMIQETLLYSIVLYRAA